MKFILGVLFGEFLMLAALGVCVGIYDFLEWRHSIPTWEFVRIVVTVGLLIGVMIGIHWEVDTNGPL